MRGLSWSEEKSFLKSSDKSKSTMCRHLLGKGLKD
jgi:hypothetical protein